MGMIIDKFLPDYFEGSAEIDYAFLEEMFGHKMQYAAKGRHSIRHVIAASGRMGAVVIPAYACSSIPEAVNKCGNEIVFCDIDEKDLNISVEAFKKIISSRKVSFLLVPSLYGNPADLEALEQICRENDIYMIDDAAQSFGAKIGSRFVGSFGNAGFFAFSPGKPLTSSMGSFFWTDNIDYHIHYQKPKSLVHEIAFKDFYYNRVKVYHKETLLQKLFFYSSIAIQKKCDLLNDAYTKREGDMIGMLLSEYKSGHLFYRQLYFDRFKDSFSGRGQFRLVTNLRGKPNNHKIVLVFEDSEKAVLFRDHLKSRQIYTSRGYNLLGDSNTLRIGLSLNNRIVELPIENDESKMDYLYKVISNYCTQY